MYTRLQLAYHKNTSLVLQETDFRLMSVRNYMLQQGSFRNCTLGFQPQTVSSVYYNK